ncbi:hypothetical protein [Streptomyces tsukubensis]|uniref:Uncharacterized protein n=1 Tax=Streptomyces tsukubensis TaxID=83656 RepID=A0A1V4ADI8_9ACTN|nr:hypothetical protein [Streptomyces tsukubensis]OON81335.1 hypothetical protein B1H18_08295 [Streptomyces tsukubensis]QFR95547.1 hypothetical protein GBW32_24140 [Streptomyces tsukubensis]
MSLQDDVTAVQRCLDELSRGVDRLERQLDGGLDIRRVRADTDHLRASVALLRETAPSLENRADFELVGIPDTPYDTALWTDADDEGLGSSDRRAP